MKSLLIAIPTIVALCAIAYLYHSVTTSNLREKLRIEQQEKYRAQAQGAAGRAAQRADDSLVRAVEGTTDARGELDRRIQRAKQ